MEYLTPEGADAARNRADEVMNNSRLIRESCRRTREFTAEMRISVRAEITLSQTQRAESLKRRTQGLQPETPAPAAPIAENSHAPTPAPGSLARLYVLKSMALELEELFALYEMEFSERDELLRCVHEMRNAMSRCPALRGHEVPAEAPANAVENGAGTSRDGKA